MAVPRPEGRRPAARAASGSLRQRRVLQLSPVPSRRLWLVYLLMAAGLGGLALRLAWVQVVQGPELLNRARAVQTQTITPLGRRRTIVDRQGSLVALDEERFTLWAHPRYFAFAGDDAGQLRSPLDVARKLSAVLALPMADLTRLMEGRKSGVKLASDLDPETAQRVRQLGISGVDLEPYPQRVYPQGGLFANVVGFLNLERVPQAGLEQSRDRDLRRHESTRQLRRGADGTPLPDGLKAGVLY
ncbi:MAG: penicillin-binding protein 2, partial [Cyanobacteria bacterium M_surface_10_m2_179]|nr:penicillin-binding protein 2 [Cyanobacteria bacterium M_surface_10_m2_179]